jgi:hypothetical protein
MKAAPALLEHAVPMRYLLGNKIYDADRLRELARDADATSVIPGLLNTIACRPGQPFMPPESMTIPPGSLKLPK